MSTAGEGEPTEAPPPIAIVADDVAVSTAAPAPAPQTQTQTQTQPLIREMFVGDLSYYCTEQDLFQLFSQCGHVEKLRIRRSADGLHSLMYGFATMRAHHEAVEVVRRFNNHMLIGRNMRVQLIRPDCRTASIQPHRDGVQLHISFISHQNADCIVTEEILRGLFQRFGRVLDVTICRNRVTRNPPKQGGFGFVKMETADAAQLARQGMAQFQWNNITFDTVFSHSSTLQGTESNDASVESSAVLTAAADSLPHEASSPANPADTRRTSARQGSGRQQASSKGRGNRQRSIENPTQPTAPSHALSQDFSWPPHHVQHLQSAPPSSPTPLYAVPVPARWHTAPQMGHNATYAPSPALGMQAVHQHQMIAPPVQSFHNGVQVFNFPFAHIPQHGSVAPHAQPHADPNHGSNVEIHNAEGSVMRYAIPGIPHQTQSPHHSNQPGVTYFSLPPTHLHERHLHGNVHTVVNNNARMSMLNFPLVSPPTPVPIASPRNPIQYYWSVDHSGPVPVSPGDAVIFPSNAGGYYMAPQQQGGAYSAFPFPSEHAHQS